MSRAENPPVVQRFSDEYIKRCRELSPQEIVRFLDDYRMLFGMARMRDRSTLPHPSGNTSTTRAPFANTISPYRNRTCNNPAGQDRRFG